MRLLLITMGLVTADVHAIPWPIVDSPVIRSCREGGEGACSQNVNYEAAGTAMVDVAPVIGPAPGEGTKISTLGVHCAKGNALEGKHTFEGCSWMIAPWHAPSLATKCELKSTASWELTDDSTCQVQTWWGPHHGAGPGGECVVFVQKAVSGHDSHRTPWGDITADQAANGGNRFCSKPLPPNLTCEISLPSVIDHGVVRPGETSKREDDGVMDCGSAPKVDVLVNGDTNKNGVKISAVPSVLSPTQLRITTEVVVGTVASAGAYSASYVFVASPY